MPDAHYHARIRALHQQLCIPDTYATQTGLPLYEEATELVDAGQDVYGRDQRMTPATREAWERMRTQAAQEGVTLLLVSAFRGVDYQAQIFTRKLGAGQRLEDILRVNAAPGHSEHHTGRALDIGTTDSPPLETCFEQTPAFSWLRSHAAEFGFVLSFDRDNSCGIAYEPWHWCFSSAS